MVSLAPLRRARRTARSKAGCTEAVASTSTRMLLNGSIRSPFLWPRSHEMRDTHDLLDRQDERNATPGVVQFRRASAELLGGLGLYLAFLRIVENVTLRFHLISLPILLFLMYPAGYHPVGRRRNRSQCFHFSP